jgi:hypothetical protein
VLLDVKERLGARIAPREGEARETVDAKELVTRIGISKRDLDDVIETGLVSVTRGPRGSVRIAKEDEWTFELLAEVRAAGFTRELGFGAGVLVAMYEDAMSTLIERETKLLADRLEHLPPARVAAMIERILPIVATFLARFHDRKIREFFASM